MLKPSFCHISNQAVMMLELSEYNKVIDYQLRMIQDNTHSHLLPISCIYKGNQITLSWRTTSMQPLPMLFERRCWTVQDLIHLVRQLYRLLVHLDESLLDSESLLLESQYIMVEPVNLTIKLAYVPIDTFGSTDNMNHSIQSLLQQWIMDECKIHDGSEVINKGSMELLQLLQLLNNPNFHWRDLTAVCHEISDYKKTIPEKDRAISTKSITDVNTRREREQAIHNNIYDRADGSESRIERTANQKKNSIQYNPLFPYHSNGQNGKCSSVTGNVLDCKTSTGSYSQDRPMNFGFVNITNPGKNTKMENMNHKEASLREKIHEHVSRLTPFKSDKQVAYHEKINKMHITKETILFAIVQLVCALLILLAWSSGTLSRQNEELISVILGLLLFVGALETMIIMKIMNRKRESGVIQRSPSSGLLVKSQKKAMPAELNHDIEKKSEFLSTVVEGFSVESGTQIDTLVSLVDNLGKGTNQEPAFDSQTQLLNQTAEFILIYRTQQNKEIRIFIKKYPFLLGRLSDQVDGVIEHPTVGKIHAEIRRVENQIYIVDLNSRNGSFLNDIQLVPYVPSSIDDTDRIQLANEELVFRRLDNGKEGFSGS